MIEILDNLNMSILENHYLYFFSIIVGLACCAHFFFIVGPRIAAEAKENNADSDGLDSVDVVNLISIGAFIIAAIMIILACLRTYDILSA